MTHRPDRGFAAALPLTRRKVADIARAGLSLRRSPRAAWCQVIDLYEPTPASRRRRAVNFRWAFPRPSTSIGLICCRSLCSAATRDRDEPAVPSGEGAVEPEIGARLVGVAARRLSNAAALLYLMPTRADFTSSRSPPHLRAIGRSLPTSRCVGGPKPGGLVDGHAAIRGAGLQEPAGHVDLQRRRPADRPCTTWRPAA